jgi:hypothetical protein
MGRFLRLNLWRQPEFAEFQILPWTLWTSHHPRVEDASRIVDVGPWNSNHTSEPSQRRVVELMGLDRVTFWSDAVSEVDVICD